VRRAARRVGRGAPVVRLLPAGARHLWIAPVVGHLRYLLEQVGFAEDDAHDEVHWAGELAHIPRPGEPPIEGLWLHRGVGNLATRFSRQRVDEGARRLGDPASRH
jgi:hypothetical protein